MSNVVEELRAWLEDGGFPALPLPRRFHADLQKKGGCFYSTLGDGPVPYNFDECVAAVRAGAPDHLVVAHQGHGINSYAFSYHLVTGQVRLLLQLSWGGVYQS
jgi:hypothetical protein